MKKLNKIQFSINDNFFQKKCSIECDAACLHIVLFLFPFSFSFYLFDHIIYLHLNCLIRFPFLSFFHSPSLSCNFSVFIYFSVLLFPFIYVLLPLSLSFSTPLSLNIPFSPFFLTITLSVPLFSLFLFLSLTLCRDASRDAPTFNVKFQF